MAVSVVLVRLATLAAEEIARVKVPNPNLVDILHLILKCIFPFQTLMNVPLILIPVIKMQCVLTLKAALLVHVTLDQLVMAYHVVSVSKKLIQSQSCAHLAMCSLRSELHWVSNSNIMAGSW